MGETGKEELINPSGSLKRKEIVIIRRGGEECFLGGFFVRRRREGEGNFSLVL